LVAAGAAAFGRVFAEVGVSMMLGGNLRFETRNLATGVAFETGKGEFAVGLALGMVLLAVALGVNALVAVLQPARRVHG
jgi:tungstate transport system permease protein